MKKPKPRPAKLVVEYDPSLIGYARVSTEDQNLDMQIEALKRQGCHPDNIHVEKVSGAAVKRPAREMARRQLRTGMTLVPVAVVKLAGRDRSILQ